MGRYWICLAPWMPPAKLPKPLSRFIGGFRGVGQTSSLAITCALAPTFADIDRGSNSMTFRCNARSSYFHCRLELMIRLLMCMYSWPTRNSRSIFKRKESIPKLAELCQCAEQLQEQGIQAPGWRCEALEDNVGSAWLPVCRLRSLPKVLPGFVAGVQRVRQDSNDSSHNLSAPSNIRCHRPIEVETLS